MSDAHQRGIKILVCAINWPSKIALINMLDGDGASRSGSQLFYLACRPDRTENVLMMSALSFGMRLKILRQRGFLQLGIPENKLQYTSKLSARKALKSSWLPLPVDLEIVG